MNDSGNSDAKAGAQLVAPAQTPTTLDRGPGERALLASEVVATLIPFDIAALGRVRFPQELLFESSAAPPSTKQSCCPLFWAGVQIRVWSFIVFNCVLCVSIKLSEGNI